MSTYTSSEGPVPQSILDLAPHVVLMSKRPDLDFAEAEPEPLHLYNISVDAPAGWGERIYEALELLACQSITVSDEGPSEIL